MECIHRLSLQGTIDITSTKEISVIQNKKENELDILSFCTKRYPKAPHDLPVEIDVEKVRTFDHVITSKHWCLARTRENYIRSLLVLAKAVKFE